MRINRCTPFDCCSLMLDDYVQARSRAYTLSSIDRRAEFGLNLEEACTFSGNQVDNHMQVNQFLSFTNDSCIGKPRWDGREAHDSLDHVKSSQGLNLISDFSPAIRRPASTLEGFCLL